MRRWWWLLTLSAAVQAAGPPVVVRSETHPGRQNDFTFDLAPLTARRIGDEPAPVRLDRVEDPSRGGYLRATNLVAGGFFGIQLYEARQGEPILGDLSFDYRADPNLKVNLIARVRHQDYELGFTGPRDDTGSSIWLGQLEGVVADGQWHHLDIPLLRLLRREVPWASLRLSELKFENRHQGDYLLAGFGGNQQGTTLSLDSFRLERAGPAVAELSFEVPGGAADGFAVALDQQPDTTPAEKVTQTAAALTTDRLADGVHWVHVRAHDASGWGPTTHYRLTVDTAPPRVGVFNPKDGEKACPAVWTCRLVDEGSGVAPQSIRVGLGDQILGVEETAVQYDPLAAQLEVDLARTGASFAANQAVKLSVTAADENGNEMPAPAEASFVFTPALDEVGPESPELALALPGVERPEPLPGEGTFEYGQDEWRPFGSGGVVVERTTETAASGDYSLKVRCTENASDFSVFVRRTPFDAARYRLVSFDYRADDRLRVDFLLRFGDRYCRVRFTDRDNDEAVIGAVPDVKQDGQWHHAEFNLYEMLAGHFPRATDFTVGMLLLTGGPWSDAPKRHSGSYAGTEYFIDNFHLVPMLGADTQLRWSGLDLTGVAGAEIATARAADALPENGREVKGMQVGFEDVGQGLVYVRARLFDGQGNRSRPVTMRMLIDAGRPQIGGVWPADGSKAAPATVGLELKDDEGAGLDLQSVQLAVAGETYRIDQRVLSYDAAAGRLIWDGRRADVPIRFKDGQQVQVKLLEARDSAGNRPKSLPAWQFTMDYAADQRGPDVEVSSRTHPVNLMEGFETGYHRLTLEPEGAAVARVRADERESGQALWLEPAGADRFQVWQPFESPYAASRFGLLSFDYRIPKGVEVDLLVRARRLHDEMVPRAIGLTGGKGGDIPRLGEVPGIVADGQWHQAIVPLLELLQPVEEFLVPYIVGGLGFQVKGAKGQPVGLDNLVIFREASSRLARISWDAFDETGVVGYSYVLDDQPRTVPAAKVMSEETRETWRDVAPGLSYFHIRALDGAGNWGPTTHFLLQTPDR